MTSAAKEFSRQRLHALMVLPVLLLPYLLPLQAACLALLALLMNLFILPRISLTKSLFRNNEPRLGGITLYPLSVLILIGFTPTEFYPWLPGVAWVTLALGDSAATICGQKWNSPKLPWNKSKSTAGTCAFFFCSATGSLLLLSAWGFPKELLIKTVIVASLTGAIAESIPLPWDDNLTVPLLTACVLWLSI